MSEMTGRKELTINDFYRKLSERVSDYNARLLLHTAKMKSGVEGADNAVLGLDQARAMCLALINKGGPAFQVGKDLYRELQ